MAKHLVAAQLYVFSQHYGQQKKTLEDNLGEALADVAAAGFEGVEGNLSFAGTPEKAERLKGLLAKNRLRLAGLFHGGVYHEREQAEKTVAEMRQLAPLARQVGCTLIDVNPGVKRGAPKTDDELAVQGEYLDKVGAVLREQGLTFVTHNHTPEILNGARETRSNLRLTRPENMGLCVDTHWVLRGGESPIGLLREWGSRVKALHLRNSTSGVWSESFGPGDIDHKEIAAWIRQTGYAGPLIVELAYEAATPRTRPLRENLRLGREYIREVFGC